MSVDHFKFLAIWFCLLPALSLAQSPQEAARETQQTQQELEKTKTEVQNKETELGEQKKIAEDAQREIDQNKDVSEEIKTTQDKITQTQETLNKVLNGLPLDRDDLGAIREAVGGDTAPTAKEILGGILRDKLKELQEKLKELKELEDDPERDQKRMAAEEKLRNANKRIGELEEELKVARPKITRLAGELGDKQKAEAAAVVDQQVRDAERKKRDAEQRKKDADERLKEMIKRQKEAIRKLNEARAEVERRKALPGAMATAFRIIREAAIKIAGFVAGDLGETIADLATKQLDIGAQILDNLDKLIPDIDEIGREPNGSGRYVAISTGQIYIINLINALNELVAANKELEGAINAAKQAKTNLEEATTNLEAKQRQKQQQSQADQNSSDNEISYSFVPNSHQFIASTIGQQQLASLQDLAQRGDLQGTKDLVARLRNQPSFGNDSQIVLNVANEIVLEADRLTNWLVETKKAAGATSTPVDAVNVVASRIVELGGQSSTSLAGLPVHPQQFRLQVFDQYQNAIVGDAERQIEMLSEQPQVAGASVIKGTASFPDTPQMIPPTVTVTLKLFDDAGDPQGEETQTAQPESDGSFEFNLPENAVPDEVRIAGPDIQDVRPRSGTIFLEDRSGRPRNQNSVARSREQPNTVLRPYVEIMLAGKTLTRPNPVEDHLPLDELILGRPRYQKVENDPFVGALRQPEFGYEFGTDLPPLPKVQDGNQPQQITIDPTIVQTTPRDRKVVVAVDPSEYAGTIEDLAGRIPGNDEVNSLWRNDPDFDAWIQGPDIADYDWDGDDELLQHRPMQHGSSEDSTPSGIEIHVIHIDPNQGINQGELEKSLESIRGQNGVLFVEQDQPRIGEGLKPADPYFKSSGSWKQNYADQWGLHRVMQAEQDSDWPAELESAEECVVAVIGSGVDWTHPELLGQMWRNVDEIPENNIDDDQNGFVDDSWGYNFRDNNNDVLDYGGHDTHIAGVIASRWDDYGIAGVNPKARIMALKAANQLAQSDSISIAEAIVYAANNGARVINLSYGGPAPSRVEQVAINYAVSKGLLVVVASGNKAVDASDYAIAGTAGVLTVAGTTIDNKRAPFSNYGLTVDISAPAMDVLGLRARGSDFLLYVAENEEYVGGTGIVGKDRDLYRASGTSFAAPYVSGAASLLFSLDPAQSNSDVARRLLASVTDIETVGPDQLTGSGLLNIPAAMEATSRDYLHVKIESLEPTRVDQKIVLNVTGQVIGSRIDKRELQIAFGEEPQEGDWKTVSTSFDTINSQERRLGTIPISYVTKRGIWSVRVRATNLAGKTYEARATININ